MSPRQPLIARTLVVAILVVACTTTPPVVETPTPAATPAPTPTDTPTPGPTPTRNPTPSPTPTGQPITLFYESVGPGFHRLYRWVVDGVAAPQVAFEHATSVYESDDAHFGYSVSADGVFAIRSEFLGDEEQWELQGIDLSTGTSLWETKSSVGSYRYAWSADGKSAISQVSEGNAVALIDAKTGDVQVVDVPIAAFVAGFAATGNEVILKRDSQTELPDSFFEWDPGTARLEPLSLGDIAIADSLLEQSVVSPLRGLRVVHSQDGASALVNIKTGASTPIEGLPPDADGGGITRLEFDPLGDRVYGWWSDGEEFGVAPVEVSKLYVATPPGRAAEVWAGVATPNPDFTFSADAKLVAFQRHYRVPEITVLEPGTGPASSVNLPIGADAFSIVIDRLTGSGPIPPSGEQWPAMPTPSAPPEPTAIDGAPRFVTIGLFAAEDSIFADFNVVAPAQGGRLASVASTHRLVQNAQSGKDAYVAAVARPGSDQLLLMAGSDEGRAWWLWTPGTEPVDLTLPDDLKDGYELIWSLDGRRVFGRSGDAIAWFEPDTGRHGRTKLPRSWLATDIVGVTDAGNILLQDQPYTDSPQPCRGPYTHLFDIGSGAITPYEPAHDVSAVFTAAGYRSLSVASGFGAAIPPYGTGTEIQLTRNCADHSDDRTIRLPNNETGDWLDWSPDGLSLFVAVEHGGDRVIYRYDRPWARPNQDPILLGDVPADIEPLDYVATNDGWLILRGQAFISCLRAGVIDASSGTEYRSDTCGSISTNIP